eukprot:GHVH01007120.1.p1 GENE.GHVH01007120.1~~GHVH01007120.1.p1  ORF type:complete len:218 (+),score=6.35 GHVH01007120.1:292-945(+)
MFRLRNMQVRILNATKLKSTQRARNLVRDSMTLAIRRLMFFMSDNLRPLSIPSQPSTHKMNKYPLAGEGILRRHAPKSLKCAMTSTKDRYRPQYYAATGEWVLHVRSLPDELSVGVVTRAARKSERWQIEFTFSNGDVRKFYLCHLCLQQGEQDIWIGYKNFVHQHIPRHHAQEACQRCPICFHQVYMELLAIHVRTCKRKHRADIDTMKIDETPIR